MGQAPAPKGKLAGMLDWFKSEPGADPWASGSSPPSQQETGVAAYGAVWASKNCAGCDAVIRQMQSQLNRAAAALGTPINVAVDGKVGPATVGAFQTVSRAAVTRGIPSGATLLAYSSAELIAKHADDILMRGGDLLAVVLAWNRSPEARLGATLAQWARENPPAG